MVELIKVLIYRYGVENVLYWVLVVYLIGVIVAFIEILYFMWVCRDVIMLVEENMLFIAISAIVGSLFSWYAVVKVLDDIDNIKF